MTRPEYTTRGAGREGRIVMRLAQVYRAQWFYCARCDELQRVVAMGDVVSGPMCLSCRREMSPIIWRQLTLFAKESSR